MKLNKHRKQTKKNENQINRIVHANTIKKSQRIHKIIIELRLFSFLSLCLCMIHLKMVFVIVNLRLSLLIITFRFLAICRVHLCIYSLDRQFAQSVSETGTYTHIQPHSLALKKKILCLAFVQFLT